LSAYYPTGAGVFSGAAIEEGRLLGAIGRQAFITLSFDVDELGIPTHIQVEHSSETVWNDQAIAVLRAWRFTPGMTDGGPVSVPCTVDLAWGPRDLGSKEVEQLIQALHPPSEPSRAVWAPEVIYSPNPPYPEQARNAGVEGTVTVVLVVGEDGTPRSIRVTEGLGTAVDGSVTKTLSQWRFRPLVVNGQSMITPLIIDVSFKLPDRVSSEILDTGPSLPRPNSIQPVPRQ
jgi:TonB family protein